MGAASSKGNYNIRRFDWSNPHPYVEFMINIREEQYRNIERITKKNLSRLLEEDVYILKHILPKLTSSYNTRVRSNNTRSRSISKNTPRRPSNNSNTRRANNTNARLEQFGLTKDFLDTIGLSKEKFAAMSDNDFIELLTRLQEEQEEQEEEESPHT